MLAILKNRRLLVFLTLVLCSLSFIILGGTARANPGSEAPWGVPGTLVGDYDYRPPGGLWGHNVVWNFYYPPAGGPIYNLCPARSALVPSGITMAGTPHPGDWTWGVHRSSTIYAEIWGGAYWCGAPTANPVQIWDVTYNVNVWNPSMTGIYWSSGRQGTGWNMTDIDPNYSAGSNWMGVGLTVQGLRDGENIVCYDIQGSISEKPGYFSNLGWCTHVWVQLPRAPEGWAGGTTCTNLRGWTLDRDRPDISLEVHVYADGPAGTGTGILATYADKDDAGYNLGPVIGVDGGNHAYDITIPPPWNTGGHTFYVHALGVDINGVKDGINPVLSGHPVRLQTTGCSPPPPPSTFDFTPSANNPILQPDEEAPTTLKVDTMYVNLTGASLPAAGIQATATRKFFWKRNGVVQSPDLRSPSAVTSQKFTAGQTNFSDPPITVPPPNLQAGDEVCVTLTITPGGGTIDSAGNILTSTAAESSTACSRLANKPYLSFYGNDVATGGSFPMAGSCGASGTGKIMAYYRDIPGSSGGSGNQLAVMAKGTVDGFVSAALRTTTPTPLKGLTLANTSGTYGGGFSASPHCLPDYFAAKPATPNSTTDVFTIQSSTPDPYYIKPYSPTLSLENPGNNDYGPGVRKTLYVEGNLLIRGNIRYSGTWGTQNDIPSIYIVVKGDIYIDKSVTQLDGTYIAQPIDSTNGGKIYTCVSSTPLFRFSPAPNTYYSASKYTAPSGTVPAAMYADCNNKLTVNGAFIANQVKFLRTFGSLRDSVTPTPKPAEVFNFSPETYLAPGPPPSTASSVKKYDYITSLPPVL